MQTSLVFWSDLARPAHYRSFNLREKLFSAPLVRNNDERLPCSASEVYGNASRFTLDGLDFCERLSPVNCQTSCFDQHDGAVGEDGNDFIVLYFAVRNVVLYAILASLCHL